MRAEGRPSKRPVWLVLRIPSVGRWWSWRDSNRLPQHFWISVTQDVYSHVLPHLQDDAAQRMEGPFRKKVT